MSMFYFQPRSKLKFLFIALIVTLLCIGGGFLVRHKLQKLWFAAPSAHTPTADAFSLPGGYYQTAIPPEKTDHYLSAEYRLWIPDSPEKIRGLVVKQHGCGDDAAATGLDHANDVQWQALAAKHQLALLGTKLPTGDQPCEYWALINYGSRKAFLKALQDLAAKSQRPELTEIPWVLWGHSGGADWAAQMLQEYPERTIAMVGVRGGGFQLLGRNPALAGIPVLFALGKQDPYAYETVELPQQAFLRYREIDAPWTIAIDPNAAHEAGASRYLAIPYLDAVIDRRLTNLGLRPIQTATGWLGSTLTHTVASAKQYQANPQQAVWLPNQEVAHKWQEYVSEGKVSPTHRSAAPTNVQILKHAGEIMITWNYKPALETGLPSFHIYRDNVLIGTVKGQEHNFGDAPEPFNVLLKFADKNRQFNSNYAVAAFNALGELSALAVEAK